MIRSVEELDKLVREVMKGNAEGTVKHANQQAKPIAASAMIRFSANQVRLMGEAFVPLFLAGGGIAHVEKALNGKGEPFYTLRYCRHGINISVTDKDLTTAKALFIKATNQIRGEL